MDKCWFVLPQTHYPPPQENSDNGGFGQTGPICLGHIIKDLRHLDQVINPGGPEPFPLDMPIYRTRPTDFEWEENKEQNFDIAATVDVPIGAAAGVTAKASLGLALKKTVGNYWQIDHLDTMIVQPTRAYINLCLASAPVAEFIESIKLGPTWSIFMITGLKIVRGNSSQKISHGRERGIRGGPGVGVAGIAEVTTDGGISSQHSISVSAKYTNDFVWAVRFSKIAKGLFVKDWRQKTFTKDATFSMDDSSTGMENIKEVLLDEGLLCSEIFAVDSGGSDDEIVVVPETIEQIA
ncbi:hypothetical protein EDB81DRAFT_871577 [Dactylonectria macrodidyma]|uniref:Uncharacterized protein n=1 Tax=Dactylonectria macrodidyma TaxID=307937 RepID=A0A9P9E4H5_9HYPO|nr:hypothetical protein EDB81DRAFT_871577 [Dactylonectria macrodidyma]